MWTCASVYSSFNINWQKKILLLFSGSLGPPNGQPLGHPNQQLSSSEQLQYIQSLVKDMDSALIQRDRWTGAQIVEGASGGLVTRGVLLPQHPEQILQPRAQVAQEILTKLY